MALGIALVDRTTSGCGSRASRGSLILLPWAVPPIVNGLLWAFIFNAQYGYLNRTLSAIGLIDELRELARHARVSRWRR